MLGFLRIMLSYLRYVRSSPNYQSKFISTKREYSKSHPDGIEISIFKDEI